MRKKIAATEENRRSLKQRLRATLAMLLVAVILAVTSTYAWLILSVAPEVRGISTTIGANGSLEIALLNKDTFSNPNAVPTVVGASLSNNVLEANETWGNMVDLNDQSYGLQEIVLYPARLNVKGTPGNYTVDRNGSMLLVPTYGSDGRITQLTDKTVTGTYGEDGFYSSADGEFGVRAIGTVSSFSVQSSALAQAKRNIPTYITGAINSAKSSVDGVQDLLLKFAAGGDSFTEEDIEMLQNMIERLSSSEEYIESALRQGMVAMAASAVKDESSFELVRSLLLSGTDISALLANEEWTKLGYEMPEQFLTWVNKQEAMENNLEAAYAACGELDSATATKQEIKVVLNFLMDLDQVLVGSKPFTQMTKDELVGMVGTGIELTLKPGSGVYADIADFTGNYSASVGSLATMKTVSSENPSYLNALLVVVNALTAADGGSTASDAPLEDTFGYVLDLAFRCNAYQSDLLLQAAGTQRVYDDSESDATMGGGSYMEFTTAGDMDFERLTKLMNAVRVAFVDDAGNLLGVAKLNVSNRTLNEETGNVMAPLYLYDFEIGTTGLEAGRLIMGERRKADSSITSLERNMAKAVSTLVWLDGDIVDNTTVSAETNISGILNLQFASSVDLLPADNNALQGYVADKDGLTDAVNAAKEIYDAGQSNYTTVSWANFANTYTRAVAVNNNPISSENLVYNTILDLEAAKTGLQTLDDDVLNIAISQLRDFMGQTDEDAYLIHRFDENGNPVFLEEATQQQLDAGIVGYAKSVDYTKNLRNEGNGLYTPIYTDESWYALADTLYFAEALLLNPAHTPAQKDMAITQMQLAYEALDFAVYFTAYDYKDTIYYKASSQEADTYGKWYYSDFTRVIDELLLLELDAYAKPAEIASIAQDKAWVDDGVEYLMPSIGLNTDLYPELKSQTVLGVHWSTPDEFALAMTEAQYNEMLYLMASHYDTSCSIYQRALEVTTPDTGTYFLHQVSYDAANDLLADLYVCLHDVEGNRTHMTTAQISLLIQLINEAESVPNYNYYGWLEDGSAEKTNLGMLYNKVESAQAVLSADRTATYAEAEAALNGLQEALAQNHSPMTYEQEMLLRRAIRNAKSLPNYGNYEALEDGDEKTKLTALHEKVAAAQAVLGDSEATFVGANTAKSELNAAIAVIDPSPALQVWALMTYEQRIVLNKAILNAKFIEGFDDPEFTNEENYKDAEGKISEADQKKIANMLALREKVTAAYSELYDSYATYEGAMAALDALNAAIAEFDATLQATEYNTIIQYTVPSAMKSYNVAYMLDADMPVLLNDAPVGEYTFTAVMITTSGVVYKTENTFTIYNKAAGVEIPHLTTNLPEGGALTDLPSGEKNKYGELLYQDMLDEEGNPVLGEDGEPVQVPRTMKAWDGKIKVGKKVTLPAAKLVNRMVIAGQETVGTYEDRVTGKDEEGNDIIEQVEIMVTKDVYEALPTTEKIVKVTYSTSDSDILEWVSGTTFEAKSTGTVTIYVTVVTEQGNTYSASYPVSVEVVE